MIETFLLKARDVTYRFPHNWKTQLVSMFPELLSEYTVDDLIDSDMCLYISPNETITIVVWSTSRFYAKKAYGDYVLTCRYIRDDLFDYTVHDRFGKIWYLGADIPHGEKPFDILADDATLALNLFELQVKGLMQ